LSGGACKGTDTVTDQKSLERRVPARMARWWAVAVFAGIALTFGLYLVLNAAPPPGRWPAFYPTDPATGQLLLPATGAGAYQAWVLKSWLDAAVPFVPLMAVPYLSFLVLVPLVVPLLNLVAGSYRRFLTMGLALIVSQLALAVAYILFPTTVIRVADPGGGLGGFLVRAIWGNDQPFAAFPSGHCTWTTIAIISLWRIRGRYPRLAWGLLLWLALVYPATVMLQQHYLIDVYGGIFVGFGCYWACMFIIERPRLVPRDEEPLPGRGEGGAA
jgi:membrane-associated phospholipid phosphatase